MSLPERRLLLVERPMLHRRWSYTFRPGRLSVCRHDFTRQFWGTSVLKIMIAEDVHMVRGALTALLDMEGDMSVVAQVGRGDEIVPAALRTRPDIAILDVDLPVLDGLSAAQELHTRLPSCRTLILTGMGRPGTMRRALSVS